MENKKYVFGENSQVVKAAKIAACYNTDIAKSDIGYAFGNSNPDMNSIKFNKKGEDLIKMISSKKEALQVQYDVIEAQRAAIKTKLIKAGIEFKQDPGANYDQAVYNYDTTPQDVRELCYQYNNTYTCERLMQEIKTCQTLIDNLDDKKTYNLSTPQLLSLQKAVEFDIMKAEGSRGGKVIGHTKSGKPIYDSVTPHKDHKGFEREDHEDAATLLREKQKKSTSAQKQYDYKDQVNYHERLIKKKEEESRHKVGDHVIDSEGNQGKVTHADDKEIAVEHTDGSVSGYTHDQIRKFKDKKDVKHKVDDKVMYRPHDFKPGSSKIEGTITHDYGDGSYAVKDHKDFISNHHGRELEVKKALDAESTLGAGETVEKSDNLDLQKAFQTLGL